MRGPKIFFIRRILWAGVFTALCAQAMPAFARDMEAMPIARLQSLDKITARTQTFEVKVGDTVKFGPLYIKVQSCQKASPLDQPESAGFVQIWEMTPQEKGEAKPEWIFSGWMFASSPALSHMDHPIYDVWVLDCKSDKPPEPAPEKKPEADQKSKSVDESPDDSEPVEGLGE